jgi:hypothetical protein
LPPAPQLVTVAGLTQLPFWQQPFGQLVGLHDEQTPASQPPPGPQLAQTRPPVPHAALLPVVSQAPPSAGQHPFGHEVESQVHFPATQRRPFPQAGFNPHWQAPFTQRSALVALHATQAEPLAPQEAVVGARHPASGSQQPAHVPQREPAS